MFEQITRQQYINIETFRKNGQSVRTPVWFVLEDNTIFVRTIADSGKVKRIRRQKQVNIAPCKVDGTLLGEWMPGNACEVIDETTAQKVDRMLDHKYGLMKKIFALGSMLQKKKYTVLKITGEQ